ncbi:MAG: nucleoside deaminase [Actinomycetota bacterium]
MSPSKQDTFIELAVRLAVESVRRGGGPFGAVIARDGAILATGMNGVTPYADPTAHAEVVAIRNACRVLGDHRLVGCELFASCEPCPMCLAAAYWARIDGIYFAGTKLDAAAAGFDDLEIGIDLERSADERRIHLVRVAAASAGEPFAEWGAKADRVPY